MKLTNLIAAGLTATLLSTGISYAQTAPTTPAEVQILVRSEAAAQMSEVMALVDELKAQGFSYIEIRSTLLGRARIIAYSADTMREIVLSSATGEVLRDAVRAHDGSLAAGRATTHAAQGHMGSAAEHVVEGMGGVVGGTGGGMGSH